MEERTSTTWHAGKNDSISLSLSVVIEVKSFSSARQLFDSMVKNSLVAFSARLFLLLLSFSCAIDNEIQSVQLSRQEHITERNPRLFIYMEITAHNSLNWKYRFNMMPRPTSMEAEQLISQYLRHAHPSCWTDDQRFSSACRSSCRFCHADDVDHDPQWWDPCQRVAGLLPVVDVSRTLAFHCDPFLRCTSECIGQSKTRVPTVKRPTMHTEEWEWFRFLLEYRQRGYLAMAKDASLSDVYCDISKGTEWYEPLDGRTKRKSPKQWTIGQSSREMPRK